MTACWTESNSRKDRGMKQKYLVDPRFPTSANVRHFVVIALVIGAGGELLARLVFG